MLDSPFSDVMQMVSDVAYEQLMMPAFLVNMAMSYFSGIITQKVHYDILKLRPIDAARECTTPVMFILGNYDKLVPPKRIQQLFDAYGGKQKGIA